MTSKTEEDLITYITEHVSDAEAQQRIYVLVQSQPSRTMTVYRGHGAEHTSITSTNKWYSSTTKKHVAVSDFSDKEKGCCVFTIHLMNVPTLIVNEYLQSLSLLERIQSYAYENECIFVGGGWFYTSPERTQYGFVDNYNGEYECWYSMQPIQQQSSQQPQPTAMPSNVERALSQIPEDEYELITQPSDIQIDNIDLSEDEKQEIIHIISSAKQSGGKKSLPPSTTNATQPPPPYASNAIQEEDPPPSYASTSTTNAIQEEDPPPSTTIQPPPPSTNAIQEEEIEDPKQIIDAFAKNTASYVGKKALRLTGLENKTLSIPYADTLLRGSQATQNMMNSLNATLEDPQLKKETARTLNNIGAYTKIAVKAMDEPLNEAIDTISKAGIKALSGVSSGSGKIMSAFVGVIPFMAPLVETGNIVNASTMTLKHIMTASSDASGAIQKMIQQTTQNIDKELENLQSLNTLSNQIE